MLAGYPDNLEIVQRRAPTVVGIEAADKSTGSDTTRA